MLPFGRNAWAQTPVTPAARPAQPAIPPGDPLGRTTPRGTVRGFLSAAGTKDWQTATRYLNTHEQGSAAVALADQLFVVLNRGLRVQLTKISDQPEGSLSYPAEPYKDLIGRISGEDTDIDIVVERVDFKDSGSIWVFSRNTLAAIPELYKEITVDTEENGVLKFLLEKKFANIALFHWIAIFVCLPLLYVSEIALNRLLSRGTGAVRRRLRKNPNLPNPDVLTTPVRLLLLAWIIHWGESEIPLPLLGREFWSAVAALLTVAGCAWLMMRANHWCEAKISVRLGRHNSTGALSVLRFLRSGVDVLILFVGLLVLLRFFGIKATTALAGLGIGGIAFALAAQKTLENIIAGISLIGDQALRVGDFLRVGTTLGTVTHIGLRSTRIRTLDRTMANLPNGQIANASVENLSLRDRFLFHHILCLAQETSASQIRTVLAGIADVLAYRPEVENKDARVRLLRFGTSSFDLELFAYVVAQNWPDFLRIQEALLLGVMDVVEAADARISLPSQITYLEPRAFQSGRPEGAIAENQRS